VLVSVTSKHNTSGARASYADVIIDEEYEDVAIVKTDFIAEMNLSPSSGHSVFRMFCVAQTLTGVNEHSTRTFPPSWVIKKT